MLRYFDLNGRVCSAQFYLKQQKTEIDIKAHTALSGAWHVWIYNRYPGKDDSVTQYTELNPPLLLTSAHWVNKLMESPIRAVNDASGIGWIDVRAAAQGQVVTSASGTAYLSHYLGESQVEYGFEALRYDPCH